MWVAHVIRASSKCSTGAVLFVSPQANRVFHNGDGRDGVLMTQYGRDHLIPVSLDSGDGSM